MVLDVVDGVDSRHDPLVNMALEKAAPQRHPLPQLRRMDPLHELEVLVSHGGTMQEVVCPLGGHRKEYVRRGPLYIR